MAGFDGSGSTDADGTIAGYAWNFGDGSAHGTGATPSHTYAAAGTYTVTLTVTDDDGATDTVSHDVTVDGGRAEPAAGGGLHVDVDGVDGGVHVDVARMPTGRSPTPGTFGDGATSTLVDPVAHLCGGRHLPA